MKIAGDWITRAGPVMAALTGYQALFVGGCVRNALMGLPISDVDIATDARPDQVIGRMQAAGFRTVPTGLHHGTVTVLTGADSYEVTTFRQDVSTDGRHATVAFSTDIAADAARRDFTMNAIYATAGGLVIDPLGGLPDLLARRLRFVGDAGERVREDYLRILRFFRFHAIYADDGFDEQALAAIADNLAGLETLSRERVGAEMRKLLAAMNPAPALGVMAQTGVLARILPGADPRFVAPLVHLEQRPCSWLARLAVLGGENLTQALRLSRAEKAQLDNIRAELGDVTPPAALAYLYGTDTARDILHGRAAILGGPVTLDDLQRGADAVFPITAADLMPQFSGPELGKRLASLQRRWLMSDLTLTKAELLA